MKTAVSLPDDVFQAVERYKRQIHKSRNQLYAEALSEYLARHAPDEVLDAMNLVMDQLAMDESERPIDPFIATAARQILDSNEW
uniref:Ribbon-helix-helix protein, copG family n=1 Tax=Candidatus Kentrum sp. UNK TaxID=2126344 RepID=A0A451AXJ6_9GAMM|nr:MAG: hypothetical protein BECKUNK1418G_GA0071005_10317 [Candidatus Kentron sp. UNK]VFK70774.1 MAG: hypothetical protein BECKUNK1418H_GA0071006_10387 [Candidatus Kentron sp. UNK]